MATYVIGDVHGCFNELQKLVKKIQFSPEKDTLWFVGDLVNRGPDSLKCLTYVISLGPSAKMVLGNHEFHLLATYAGFRKYKSQNDTLHEILTQPNTEELIDWLRHRPIFIEDKTLNAAMVHAGIPPHWRIKKALKKAAKVEKALQSKDWQENLNAHFFGNEPASPQQAQTKWDKIRYSINCFTRLRYCQKDGTLNFSQKMHPSRNKETSLKPWFAWPNRKNVNRQIFFGHWSTLGVIDAYQVHSTDTGCLWGGKLTAFCIETQKRTTVSRQSD